MCDLPSARYATLRTVAEPQPLRGQAVDVGRPDLCPIASDIGVAQIIREDDEEVGPRHGRCLSGMVTLVNPVQGAAPPRAVSNLPRSSRTDRYARHERTTDNKFIIIFPPQPRPSEPMRRAQPPSLHNPPPDRCSKMRGFCGGAKGIPYKPSPIAWRSKPPIMSLEQHTVDPVVDVEANQEKGQLEADEIVRLSEQLAQARAATASEHKMSLLQALKRYPKASAWSVVISLAVVMEGERIDTRLSDIRVRRRPAQQLLRLPRVCPSFRDGRRGERQAANLGPMAVWVEELAQLRRGHRSCRGSAASTNPDHSSTGTSQRRSDTATP